MTVDIVALRAAQWLREISDWLLANDLDMKLPEGVLDQDPLDLADALDAQDASPLPNAPSDAESVLDGVLQAYGGIAVGDHDRAIAVITAAPDKAAQPQREFICRKCGQRQDPPSDRKPAF